MGNSKTTTTVDDVCMDITEVTVAAYGACVDAGACTQPEFQGSGTIIPTMMNEACNWKHPSGRANHPINCVSWHQAVAYCKFVGARLPNEAEWEWAARGGAKGSAYPWGDAEADGTNANACGSECPKNYKAKFSALIEPLYPTDDGFPETAPVGSFTKGDNPWGVHDLAGNVWEWTSTTGKWDWTEAAEHSIAGTPAVVRGGAWNTSSQYSLTAAAQTDREEISRMFAVVGFRCARTP